jgi:hypothetical protein
MNSFGPQLVRKSELPLILPGIRLNPEEFQNIL